MNYLDKAVMEANGGKITPYVPKDATTFSPNDLGLLLAIGIPALLATIVIFIVGFREGGILSFSGRMNRRSGALNTVIVYLLIFIGLGIFIFSIQHGWYLPAIIGVVIFIFAFARSITVTVRRLHDIGWSGICLLLLCIFASIFGKYDWGHALAFFIGISFWLIPGKKQPNKYGDVPEKKFCIW